MQQAGGARVRKRDLALNGMKRLLSGGTAGGFEEEPADSSYFLGEQVCTAAYCVCVLK